MPRISINLFSGYSKCCAVPLRAVWRGEYHNLELQSGKLVLECTQCKKEQECLGELIPRENLLSKKTT